MTKVLHFNLIYSPGTVRYHRLFTLSLLKYTRDCTFRLIANGCPPHEVQVLKELCANHTRIEFYAYPTVEIVPHAYVLAHTQAMETSRYYCNIDSDVLAVNNFVEDMTRMLAQEQYAVVSTGRNIWILPEEAQIPDTTNEISGKYSQTASGLYLGGTYCTIYDNHILNDLLKRLDPPFPVWRKLKWEDIPQRYQDILAGYGLKLTRYDTSKVLFILLQHQGHRLIHVDLPSISHIGGFTIFRAYPPGPGLPYHFMRRYQICEHIENVMEALFSDQPLPPLPTLDHPLITERLKTVVDQITSLYPEFKDELLAGNKTLSEWEHNVNAAQRLHDIENSWGWRTVLRLHDARARVIPAGSKREKTYLRLRNLLVR